MTLCRTCLSAEDLEDLFPYSDVNLRKEQLRTVTGLKISPNDGLPQKICKMCNELVGSAVRLRETSAYTEKMLLQNGFQYKDQKPAMKKEKSDLKVKVERDTFFDDNDLTFQSYDGNDNVKYEVNILSDIMKTSRTTKKKQKLQKTTRRRGTTRSSSKNIPETSTYDIDEDVIDMLASKSCNNPDTVNILNEIASMIPNDPSLDKNIEKIINNIDSEENIERNKKPKPNDELAEIYELIDSEIQRIDAETTKPGSYANRHKNLTLKDELKLLKKEHEKKQKRNKPRLSSDDLNDVYDIIDTKIESSNVKEEQGTNKAKEPAVKRRRKGTKWNGERMRTFWSMAVSVPVNKDERVQCKICHKFTKFICFARHAATHFEPEFTCEVCGMKLMSKKNLKDHHQRKHGATKSFACSQCDYRSVLPAELQNHIRRVHTGERPFICDLCSESFYQRRCLVAHMKTHYAVKKYQCDRCSNMFKSQGQLTAHYQRFHIMRYTFYCDHCAYQVSKSSKVKDHLTKVHGIPREKQAPIKFYKERREESLQGHTNTKHLRKPEDIVKRFNYKDVLPLDPPNQP